MKRSFLILSSALLLLFAVGVWGDSLQVLFEELDYEELKTISPLCKGATRFDPDYKDYCNKQYNTARHGITSQVTFEDLNLDELQSLSPLCRGEMRTDPDFKDYCFKQYNASKYGEKYSTKESAAQRAFNQSKQQNQNQKNDFPILKTLAVLGGLKAIHEEIDDLPSSNQQEVWESIFGLNQDKKTCKYTVSGKEVIRETSLSSCPPTINYLKPFMCNKPYRFTRRCNEKACGDSCISTWKTCHVGRGSACNNNRRSYP